MATATLSQQKLKRILNDSGACCRDLLGWNYDEAEDPLTGKKSRLNVGTGGVRESGPHQQMVEFVDEPKEHRKVLLAPRESYKSTILQGLVVRLILKNPNVRILYGMRTEKQIRRKARAIKQALEQKNVTAVFGEQKGELWQVTEFTVAGRTQGNLQESTFTMFTSKSLPTGGHYDYIIFDDPVDDRDYLTERSAESAEDMIRACDPLMTVGGYMILVGTRYDDNDIYASRLHDSGWTSLVLDAGVEIIRTGAGHELHGKPTFAHQTLAYLNGKLRSMKYHQFMAQYMNVIPRGLHQPFRRDQFLTIEWRPEFEHCSGYLLTDTAVTEDEKGCYTVMAYVLLDRRHVAYLADLKIGHWSPVETRDRFFEMIEKWSVKCNHVGEVMERITMNAVFIAMFEEMAIRKQIRLNLIQLERGAKNRKSFRIQRLEGRFSDRQFYVVDTVPEHFQDVGGTKVLWNPIGFTDPKTGVKMPAGELVDQFVKFPSPNYPNDIPDAIADIDATDPQNGTRVCYFHPYRDRRKDSPSVAEARARDRMRPGRSYGPADGSHGDWWDSVVGP